MSDSVSLVDAVNRATSFSKVPRIICAFLSLDLASERGLKNIVKALDNSNNTLYATILNLYSDGPANARLQAGIVHILGQLCCVTTLRDKLWAKGALELILPLINVQDQKTQQVALVALCTATVHDGDEIKWEVMAKVGSVLIGIASDLTKDPTNVRLAVQVLAHTAPAVLLEEESDPKELGLDCAVLVKAMTECCLSDSYSLAAHAFRLLSVCAVNCQTEFQDYPKATRCLVGHLRHPNVHTRVLSSLALLENLKDVDTALPELVDIGFLDRFFTQPRILPTAMQEAFAAWAPKPLETTVLLNGYRMFETTLTEALKTGDFLKLGEELGQSIRAGQYVAVEGRVVWSTKHSETAPTCQELTKHVSCTEVMNLAVQALRARGGARCEMWALIIEAEMAVLKRDKELLHVAVKVGLEKYPLEIYFYYLACLGELHEKEAETLKTARKGMKCKKGKDNLFMRRDLLKYCTEMSLKLLLQLIGGDDIELMAAFLDSASEAVDEYVSTSPPDSIHLRSMLAMQFFTKVLAGGSMFPVEELKGYQTRLEVTETINKVLCRQCPQTPYRMMMQMILENYQEAATEWDPIIRKHIEDSSQRWAEDADPDTKAGCCSPWEIKPAVSEVVGNVRHYRCNWCGNPSALLRKCRGCRSVGYCDGECQERDWLAHQDQCNKAEERNSTTLGVSSGRVCI